MADVPECERANRDENRNEQNAGVKSGGRVEPVIARNMYIRANRIHIHIHMFAYKHK